MIPTLLNRYLPEKEEDRARLFAVAGFLAGVMCSPFFSFVITGSLTSLQERATFPMIERRIEVVRQEMAQVRCDDRILAFAPLIAQAVDWNTRLAHEKEANTHFYSDYFSTDQWNQVEPIPLPCDLATAGK